VRLTATNLLVPFAQAAKPACPSAPEARQKAAHGETVGINAQTNQAPVRLRFTSTRQAGAKEFSDGDFLPPHPGLEILWTTKPTVSPRAISGRRSATWRRYLPALPQKNYRGH